VVEIEGANLSKKPLKVLLKTFFIKGNYLKFALQSIEEVFWVEVKSYKKM